MVTAAPPQTITVTKTIKASAEAVYQAFTTVDGLNSWLCGQSNLRAQVGGHIFLYWPQEQWTATGEFTELEEHEKIAFTWRGQGETSDSTVSVEINAENDLVTLTLTHAAFAEDTNPTDYESQWNTRLDNLVSIIETGADKRITDRIIIGIVPAAIPEARAEELGIETTNGAMVNQVLDGFSAQQAGLQFEDIIAEIEGQLLSPERNIFQAITESGAGVGDSVKVGYFRGSEKHSVDLVLRGYPIPDLPTDFKALSAHYQAVTQKFGAELDKIFAKVSDEHASAAPAEGEWSANEAIAHLILNERWLQGWIGGFFQGGQPTGYSCNTKARIDSITAIYNTTQAIQDELKRAWRGTAALLKHVEVEALEQPHNLWMISFQLSQFDWHTETHLRQMREAIAAARA